ncbi:hypothetical protein VTO73DRAFT_9026 [Trametes versicolor]
MATSPSASTPASTALLTLTSTATWTPFTDTSRSPASSYPSANTASASSPTHGSSSGAPQSPVLSTTSAAPAHLLAHLTAPALAGTVASVAVITTVAAALVRRWVRRRRRARARVRPELLLTQEPGELGRPTAERAPCPPILPSHARGGDTESGACTQGQSLVSGSSRGARDGSAATVERTALGSSRPPTPEMVSVENKGSESASASGGQEPSGTAASESCHERPSIDLPDASRYDVPQTARDVSADDPQIMVEDAQGERLLHLALPWVLGQRVLAFIAREDARSVESGGSEPLPAYEPRE